MLTSLGAYGHLPLGPTFCNQFFGGLGSPGSSFHDLFFIPRRRSTRCANEMPVLRPRHLVIASPPNGTKTLVSDQLGMQYPTKANRQLGRGGPAGWHSFPLCKLFHQPSTRPYWPENHQSDGCPPLHSPDITVFYASQPACAVRSHPPPGQLAEPCSPVACPSSMQTHASFPPCLLGRDKLVPERSLNVFHAFKMRTRQPPLLAQQGGQERGGIPGRHLSQRRPSAFDSVALVSHCSGAAGASAKVT